MRKPNLVSQSASVEPFSSVRYFLMLVTLLTTVSIAMSGCSRIGLQDRAASDFKPMPQPKSLTQRQQREIEKTLDEQNAKRIAKKEYTVDEAADAATSEAAQQQKDIVASAAERAAAEPSDIEQPIKDPSFLPVSYAQEIGSDESGSAAANGDDGVRLVAKASSFEGLPANAIRQEVDFSKANFLRPSQPKDTLSTEAESETVATEENLDRTFAGSPSLQLPLKPMFFDAGTRETRAEYEGTLRPLVARDEDIEARVSIEARPNSNANSNMNPIADRAVDVSMPPRPQLVRSKIQRKDSSEIESTAVKERLLQPVMPPAKSEIGTAPKVAFKQIETVEAALTEEPEKIENEASELQLQSSSELDDIVVVDPVDVDFSNSQFVPAKPTSSTVITAVEVEQSHEETRFIPAEVIEDAQQVADDLERELTANSIPDQDASEGEFKVVPTSSTTTANAGAAAAIDEGNADDSGNGEPMFANNDFGAPSIPEGGFVEPMPVAPVDIERSEAIEFVPASSNFVKPVELEAPPEADSQLSRIAALPIAGATGSRTSASDVPPVGVSTIMDLNAVTWKSRLDEAIELAETRIQQINQPADSSLVSLRLLKALRGQMEQIESAPVENRQLSASESQYWQHQLEAITTMLETPVNENQAVTDYRRHQAAHETLAHLRSAVAQLESIASLKVTSGNFCTEINGFGQYRSFASNRFKPGQKTLVYCEVENYATRTESTAMGNDFRTRLKGSFAIYDTKGKVVQQAEFPTVDDIARKRRRDFYMYMPVTIGNLPPGDYVLHALVEDIYGNKTASLDPPLEFTVSDEASLLGR